MLVVYFGANKALPSLPLIRRFAPPSPPGKVYNKC